MLKANSITEHFYNVFIALIIAVYFVGICYKCCRFEMLLLKANKLTLANIGMKLLFLSENFFIFQKCVINCDIISVCVGTYKLLT